MRAHLANAAYGLLDYAAYPIGMLVVAPIVLRNMGVAQYGVWTVATAVVSMGSIIASGFGDANIQRVANQRGSGHRDALLRTVRSMVGINLVLGTALALVAWMVAPSVARHVVSSNAVLQRDCLWSLRLASVVIFLRAQESVCISTQRAFERYGAAVRISILARVLSLAAAAVLTFFVREVAAIVAATALLTLLGIWLQFARLRKLLDVSSLTPLFDPVALQALLGFGAFAWLQAISGVVFAQADRLLLGVSLGAVAVASYALCTQIAQPIYGFAASGLHFLFPYLASRSTTQHAYQLRRAVQGALAANVLFVVLAAGGLLVFGVRILSLWAGKAIAESAAPIFSMIVWSFALLGLNVTASYSLFALGRVQIVTWINLAGGAAMLLAMVCLLPRFGLRGLAAARLCYGAITLLLYLPLASQLSRRCDTRLRRRAATRVCEEA